jgi:transcriptional regulator PpsR
MDPSQDLSALSPLASAVAQTMARVASDIAIVIDGDGVIRDVAEGPAKLPTTCADWVGRRWVDTVTADTRRKIELLLEELRRSDVTQRREVNHPSADGEDVPVAWTAIRLGEHGPVVAVGRDLRAVAAIQRRFLDAQHEMELDYWQRRNAENRFRLLFQVASDAVLVIDALSFEVVDANERALALQADARVPLVGRALTDALPAAARAQVAELLATARGTGRAGEIRIRLVPGAPAAEVSATPFRVGDRLQLLVRARQGEPDGEDGGLPSTMRALVESTPDAIVVTDSSGHILMSNPAFVALAARGGDARLQGRMLVDVVGDDDGRWAADRRASLRDAAGRRRTGAPGLHAPAARAGWRRRRRPRLRHLARAERAARAGRPGAAGHVAAGRHARGGAPAAGDGAAAGWRSAGADRTAADGHAAVSARAPAGARAAGGRARRRRAGDPAPGAQLTPPCPRRGRRPSWT